MIGLNFLIPQPNFPTGEISLSSDWKTNGPASGNLPHLWANSFKPYAQYPVFQTTVRGYDIFFEGMVAGYAPGELPPEWLGFLGNEEPDVEGLQSSIGNASGEFWLVAHRAGKIWVFNDFLGRLPIYYIRKQGWSFIGRSLKTLFEFHNPGPDLQGVQQFLWSGYPLGERTLFEEVERLPGNSILYFSFGQTPVLMQGSTLNFDEEKAQSPLEAAANLGRLFQQACQKIQRGVPKTPLVISLSGGQDSRAAAWCFSKTGGNIHAASFDYPSYENDARIAPLVADRCKIPWQKINIEWLEANEEKLLQMKQGLNYIGMTYILDFYRQLQDLYPGGLVQITGDGGDKALPYLGEGRQQLSADALTERLFRRHAIFPEEEWKRLTGADPHDFREKLWRHLHDYPEKRLNQKSIHFTIYERARKAYFEGEDRGRYYCWSTTPFYELDFFKAAMQAPQVHKKAYKLYRLFQQGLNPELARLPDASGHHLLHPTFIAKKHLQEHLRSGNPMVKQVLKKLNDRFTGKNSASQYEPLPLRDAYLQNSTIGQCLDTQYLKTFWPTASKQHQWYLETLMRVFVAH